MSTDYREYLIKTLVEFDGFLQELHINIVNLAMSGEFSDINELFDEGDSIRFDITDFKDLNDQNVQTLIKLFHLLSRTENSIRNINMITSKELDEYDDLPF